MQNSGDFRNAAEGTDETRFRPEARPLPFARLDQQQQAAFRRVVSLFHEAVMAVVPASATREAGSSQSSPVPFLDSTRSSGTILISGQRGTGKTTLLLSLAKSFTSNSRVVLGAASEPDLPVDLVAHVADINRRIVWLETLDMEPLSDTANLLGAVLARVEDAVGARFPAPEGPSPKTSILYPGYDYHNTQREMLRLQTSVALSFGGNLAERAGNLDPDNFAIESRRAERERLGINRRFVALLAALSGVLAGSADIESPLFVLPVDDLDLNPRACLLLLELLRAVHSPHLLVIIAADQRLLSNILHLRYTGEFARIAAPAPITPEALFDAGDLAANAMRKHLAPTQRVILGLMGPEQALRFIPAGHSGAPLASILGTIQLASDTATLAVAENFGVAPFTETYEQASVETSRFISLPPATTPYQTGIGRYSWPEVLRLPLRNLVDLYLDSSITLTSNGQAAQPLRQLALDLLRKFPDNEPTSVSIVARLTANQATTTAQTVRTFNFHGWEVQLPSGRLDSADTRTFTGSLDLLSDQDLGHRPIPSMRSPRQTTIPVQSPHGEPGNATPQVLTSIAWPWVEHTTCWGYERAMKWLDEVDGKWRGKAGALFGSWITVMTAQMFETSTGAFPIDEPLKGWPADWPELSDRLNKLQLSDPLASRWLVAVGLLCTPEMGFLEPLPVTLVPPVLQREVTAGRNRRKAYLPAALAALIPNEMTQSKPRSPRSTSGGTK